MQVSQMSQPITHEDVYFVQSSNKEIPLNPIAIRPTIYEKRIEWEDTGRGTARQFSKLDLTPGKSSTPEKITIQTTRNETITLSRLTLDIYNRILKKYVAGSPEFSSDEAIKQHYLKTNFDVYPE